MMNRKPKIALIGNMNNMFSALCKYLIDADFDAHLFQYDSHPSHFDADADTFGSILEGRVHIINWTSPQQLFNYPLEKIRKELSGFDFIIACGTTPAFLKKAGIKLDIFIPYGSDIYSYPFFEFAKNPIYLVRRMIFSFYQRRGIRSAKAVIMEKQLGWVEDKIASLKVNHKRVFNSIPMVHLPTYLNVTEEDRKGLQFYTTYQKIRSEYDFIIFHHSRHSWKNPNDNFELKGNNILFEGFARFKAKEVPVKSCIVTLEYGAEVNESKELIRKLGIENDVYWLPLQSRKELMLGISLSDLVVGELYSSFNLYGVTTEALQLGKPIMQKRNNSDFENDYESLHPIIYADDSLSVCEGLVSFSENPDYYKDQGKKGQQWYAENILKPFMNIIKRFFNN